MTGGAPSALFHVGTSFPISGVTGTSIPFPGRILEPLDEGKLNLHDGSKDVIITLPGNLTTTDIKWLNVWCVIFGANFADIEFPEVMDPHEGTYSFTC